MHTLKDETDPVYKGEMFWNFLYVVEPILIPTFPLRISLTFTFIFAGTLLVDVGQLQPQAPPVLGEHFMVNLSTDAELVQCHTDCSCTSYVH